MATPIVASRSSWSPHVYEQEAPAINRQQRRQQLHSMKQAIMDKLVGLPMEREDDMVGFVGWLNTFVDRSLTERGLPALTGPPRANDRQQAGMGSVYESHRKVMDDVVDDSGLRRPIRRGEGGGGAVAVGGTGRSEPLRDMSQRNHDETDLKAASSSGRAGTLTKKDTELISMLLEFSSKAAAEKSQATTSSGPPPVPMQRHPSSGHTSPALPASPVLSPRGQDPHAGNVRALLQASSPPTSPRRSHNRPRHPSSGGGSAPSSDAPPPMPAPFCRDPSLDEKANKEDDRAMMGAGLSAQNMGRRRGNESWDGVIAKRPRKTEEGCVVVVSVDRRQMSVVVAKVTQHFTYYMEPANTRMTTGVRAGRWMYYSGAIAYGSEYSLSKREIFVGQVVSARGSRPTRAIAGVVRYMEDVSRNAALMLDLEHETFYLVSMASLDASTGSEHLDTEDMHYLREKVAQWITSPLRENDSFPHFSAPPARPGPTDGAPAEQPRPIDANNATNGYRPPESGSLADVFALARTAAAASGSTGYNAHRHMYPPVQGYASRPPPNYLQNRGYRDDAVPMEGVYSGGGYKGPQDAMSGHPQAYGMHQPWRGAEMGGGGQQYGHNLRMPQHAQAALYHHGR